MVVPESLQGLPGIIFLEKLKTMEGIWGIENGGIE